MDNPVTTSAPDPTEQPELNALTRRGFLRAAGVVGIAGVAATVAACQATAAPSWSFGPAPSPTPTPTPPPATPEPSGSVAASPSSSPIPNLPAGWTEHDVNGQIKVRRFVGNLAGPLGMSPFLDNVLGPNLDDPEFTMVPQGNQPLQPARIDPDGAKVFELTVDEIEWQIDAVNPPVKALGYNKMWPGPILRVTEGDKVRITFTNNMAEPTGVHFHGIEFADFTMDGVPFVTQLPFATGESFTYEFTATPAGSHMYHSHHNATDQVGRGLLGAFIVEPKRAAESYARKYGVTQEVVFIHNDARGRVHDQRARLPGHDPDRRQGRRQGPDPVHERGHDDPPVAHPRVPDERRRPGRCAARIGGLQGGHAGRQPRRALGRDHRLRPAGRVGVPLPHPAPRRGRRRDVRHGHRARDPAARRHLTIPRA